MRNKLIASAMFLLLAFTCVQAAQIRFARTMSGRTLTPIAKVVRAPSRMQVLHEAEHHGRAVVRASNLATNEARGVSDEDHRCGNKETYSPRLTGTAHSMPAVPV